MELELLQQQFEGQFGADAGSWETLYDVTTLTVSVEKISEVLHHFYHTGGYTFLTDVCAVHYPNSSGKELAVVYHLHNLYANKRLRIKIYVSKDAPDVPTATSLYSGANWMERETYDFYGINFIGHPNLKRILNVDEMDYFPMLKQYPLEDQSRKDKDDEMFGRGGSYN